VLSVYTSATGATKPRWMELLFGHGDQAFWHFKSRPSTSALALRHVSPPELPGHNRVLGLRRVVNRALPLSPGDGLAGYRAFETPTIVTGSVPGRSA